MKKRRKDPSFDVMVRFFLQHYGIATKQDVERILVRMDRLEAAMKAGKASGKITGKTRHLGSLPSLDNKLFYYIFMFY